jgi:Na+(H+)/acetate symporter ActP
MVNEQIQVATSKVTNTINSINVMSDNDDYFVVGNNISNYVNIVATDGERIRLSPQFAVALGEALIQAGNDAKGE